MNFKIEATHGFDKQLKRLVKKFPSLKKEFEILIQSLKQNPKQGTAIGNNFYKIRVAIASKGKGKSGGARVITNILIQKEKLYLISIYDKSEQENISKEQLDYFLNQIEK